MGHNYGVQKDNSITDLNTLYSETLFWVRCRLSFSFLQSAIVCIRGLRSSMVHDQPVRHSVGLVIVLPEQWVKFCRSLFILYTSIALAS